LNDPRHDASKRGGCRGCAADALKIFKRRIEIARTGTAALGCVGVLLANYVEATVRAVSREQRNIWDVADAVGWVSGDANLPSRFGVEGGKATGSATRANQIDAVVK